jgi:Mg2+ and Co2+ transporter CorA
MPRPKRVLTAAQRRDAEHRSFMRSLMAMQKLAMKQAEVMGMFMKTYEVTTPPTSRVMSDEREWLQEQEDQQELAGEMSRLNALPNPFLAVEMD